MRTATVAALLALLFAASAIAPVAAADRDKDGLRDGFETRYGVTSPDKRDSDGDGVIDSAEDNDGDKLGNLGEQRFGTDPGERDTDDDGIPDGKEDKDRDGRSNAREQDRRPLPKGLKPSLARAKYDLPSDRKRCANLADRGAALVRCAFGPADAETTIALLGDSHALAWLPAVRAAAEQEGWRLVTLLKGSCSPVLGTIKADNWSTDRNRSCSAWRQKALEWLGSHPLDLVIITHADDARLVTRTGRTIPGPERPQVWKSGMEKTLGRLPIGTTGLVVGDVPTNTGNPLRCLKKHKANISACVRRREPLAKRAKEAALREAALETGHLSGNLYDKVCSYDPCPLVQGDVLMWRDSGHLTKTFVKRLTPSWRTLLSEAITEIGTAAETDSLVALDAEDGADLP